MNELLDHNNNTYHHSINKKPLHVDYSALTLAILKLPNDRVRFTKYKNIFSKDYTENLSREIFIMDSVLKTNPRTYKIKVLKTEQKIGSFYEK